MWHGIHINKSAITSAFVMEHSSPHCSMKYAHVKSARLILNMIERSASGVILGQKTCATLLIELELSEKTKLDPLFVLPCLCRYENVVPRVRLHFEYVQAREVPNVWQQQAMGIGWLQFPSVSPTVRSRRRRGLSTVQWT